MKIKTNIKISELEARLEMGLWSISSATDGEDGKKGEDGTKEKDGENGKNGENGKSSINGVSIDNSDSKTIKPENKQ